MSLEKIDEYMKQLKAIKNYDRVSEELEKIKRELAKMGQTLYFSESFAESLTLRMDEMQQESEGKEERIRQCHAIMDNQQEYISLLEYALKKARQDTSSLKKSQEVIRNQSRYTSKKSYRFNDFVSLGIIIDDPRTILKRKMNAIYYWLLTNGLLRL